jgi:hypothetical protein
VFDPPVSPVTVSVYGIYFHLVMGALFLHRLG